MYHNDRNNLPCYRFIWLITVPLDPCEYNKVMYVQWHLIRNKHWGKCFRAQNAFNELTIRILEIIIRLVSALLKNLHAIGRIQKKKAQQIQSCKLNAGRDISRSNKVGMKLLSVNICKCPKELFEKFIKWK